MTGKEMQTLTFMWEGILKTKENNFADIDSVHWVVKRWFCELILTVDIYLYLGMK